jgi:predicted ATPase
MSVTHHDNLPVELSSFIGREREISEVEGLLAETRLLTLTGTGGCGKTRLALRVAGNLRERFEDGVWWVSLAPLTSPDLTPKSVASALGMHEQPGRSTTEALSDHLRFRDLILVLDNCEHLIEACAALAEALLLCCPNLKILATSREPLGVAGEATWPVPSLSLPTAHRRPPVEELVRYEAVRLFVERAAAARPDFAPTEHNAPVVVEVCRELDGIPLAIELAAARTKVLTIEQIAGRLGDSFRLLTGGSRTVLPRQRTLRATIEWSFELLPEEERTMFRRLSVFAGGFTLEATEEVCSGGGIAEEGVFDLLSRLVDKSLIVTEERDGHARYRMLETVRQYGAEKLRDAGELQVIQQRHADFFLAMAEEAEFGMVGPDQAAWLGRLEEEHDNVRAALGWLQEGDAEQGLPPRRGEGAAREAPRAPGNTGSGRGAGQGASSSRRPDRPSRR